MPQHAPALVGKREKLSGKKETVQRFLRYGASKGRVRAVLPWDQPLRMTQQPQSRGTLASSPRVGLPPLQGPATLHCLPAAAGCMPCTCCRNVSEGQWVNVGRYSNRFGVLSKEFSCGTHISLHNTTWFPHTTHAHTHVVAAHLPSSKSSHFLRGNSNKSHGSPPRGKRGASGVVL